MTADLFHVGHLMTIRQAKSECDYLTIGLLDCPEYKKTVIPFNERKQLLEALPEVDRVVRQKSLYMNLKGYDKVFTGDGFSWEELESINKYGCEQIILDFPRIQSTTNIKEKIKQYGI
jgi:cytidyltransferase-like protein